MSREYWLRQESDKPLYQDLIWSRPENKRHAGKLLIVGGNAHGFAAPAEAYQESLKAGVGTARVLLPDSLEKTVGRIFEAGEYAPSTPSGSFAVKALGELLDLSMWADAVLLADNFGKNSETAILFEKYIDKYKAPLALAGDSLDYFISKPECLLGRENTLIIASFAQLQKIATASKFTKPFTSDMGLLKLVDTLHEFSSIHQSLFILQHEDSFIVSVNGTVLTMPKTDTTDTKIAAFATTWWLQNLSKPIEACASALHILSK